MQTRALAVAAMIALPHYLHDAQRQLPDDPETRVSVDSAHREVVVTAGPWTLPPGDAMPEMAHGSTNHLPAGVRFTWPVDGWIHGVRLRAFDREGEPIPRSMLHHMELLELDRRDLFLPIPERVFEMGRETADIVFPARTGIAVRAGTPMAIVMAWMNDTDDPVPGATIELSFEWSPAGTEPAPRSVMPVTLQVLSETGGSSFDVPPGAGSWATDYPFEIDGTVVAAGGHLHDQGVAVDLGDLTSHSPAPLIHLESEREAAGHVTGVARIGVGGSRREIRLRAGHRYRLEGRYDNRTGATITRGGMAYLFLLLAPAHPERWPRADTTSVLWKASLAAHGLSGAERITPIREGGR